MNWFSHPVFTIVFIAPSKIQDKDNPIYSVVSLSVDADALYKIDVFTNGDDIAIQ